MVWSRLRDALVPARAVEEPPPIAKAPVEIPGTLTLREEHIRNCRLVTDREALLAHLPRNGVVGEVGVLAGDYSASILRVTTPRKLYLIDSFDASDWAATGRFGPPEHETFVRDRFQAEIASGLVETRKGLSWECLALFPDESFDWLYIDAGHDYESVRKDLDVARTKIRTGGLIVMNDYTIYDPFLGVPYGVIHATNEFCLQHGWEIAWLALQSHMFNDVVLRKL